MGRYKKLIDILVVVGIAAFVYIKFIKKNSQTTTNGKVYVMDVGYYTEAAKENFGQVIPKLESLFASKGIDLKINQVKAGTTTPADSVEYDFAFLNTMIVMLQEHNGNSVEPLFWKKNCNINAIAMVSKKSTLKLEEMTDKKVLIFNFGYNTGTVLKAIQDWSLQNAKLLHSRDIKGSWKALQEGTVDMVISDVNSNDDGTNESTFVGTDYDRRNVKVLAVTKYEMPCRMIAINSRVPKNVRENFIGAFQNSPIGNGFELVNKNEFGKVKELFNWPELDKINRSVMPL